mgnify:CR=1 FL=1
MEKVKAEHVRTYALGMGIVLLDVFCIYSVVGMLTEDGFDFSNPTLLMMIFFPFVTFPTLFNLINTKLGDNTLSISDAEIRWNTVTIATSDVKMAVISPKPINTLCLYKDDKGKNIALEIQNIGDYGDYPTLLQKLKQVGIFVG